MARDSIALVDKKEQSRKMRESNITQLTKKARYGHLPRPRFRLDQKSVYTLASVMLSVQDIAEALGCSEDYLYRRFSGTIQQARSETKHKLANVMHRKAIEENNAQMQIWLSKQHLGYRDAVDTQQQPIAIQINIQDIPS